MVTFVCRVPASEPSMKLQSRTFALELPDGIFEIFENTKNRRRLLN
jgi:hypothetical protein